MDWTNVYPIEKMANEFHYEGNRSGFISGANVVLEYLKDIIKESFDYEDVGHKTQLLVNKLEEKADWSDDD
jgi:hypothetical protein